MLPTTVESIPVLSLTGTSRLNRIRQQSCHGVCHPPTYTSLTDNQASSSSSSSVLAAADASEAQDPSYNGNNVAISYLLEQPGQRFRLSKKAGVAQ